jgi:hypothetical protein
MRLRRPIATLCLLACVFAALIPALGCETTEKPKKTPIRGTATHPKVQKS